MLLEARTGSFQENDFPGQNPGGLIDLQGPGTISYVHRMVKCGTFDSFMSTVVFLPFLLTGALFNQDLATNPRVIVGMLIHRP